MTLEQGFAFAIVLGTIGLLIWGRIRYDLVALLALLAAIACGIVTPKDAFRGFSDDIVIIVGSALVVSAAIGRSGLVETLMKPLVPRMQTSVMQVAVLGSAVTALSASSRTSARSRSSSRSRCRSRAAPASPRRAC
jgi:di/tricarboxylate transporter